MIDTKTIPNVGGFENRSKWAFHNSRTPYCCLSGIVRMVVEKVYMVE